MSEKKNIATRDGFGHEIVALGKENPDLLVVDIDIGKSCKTGDFRKELPGQYINVGIAEQNGAGLAAGLATCGKVPFVVTYAVFGSLRMCEMIRQEVCYPNLNVKFACSHGGVTPANDGASHQSIEDMGVLRTIPNMTVIMFLGWETISSTTSMPSMTIPKAAYCPSRWGASLCMMKNWLPAESISWARAILSTPRVWRRSLGTPLAANSPLMQ